jgi:hypothetical protein
MTKYYKGRVVVTTANEEFPMKIGEVFRVRDASPRFNKGFDEYRIVSGSKQDWRADVTRHDPTTNKFQGGH